jgi:hypothetical protein
MSQIYIIANNKGGVGKTNTAVTIACLLHAAGRKFKLIELDNNNSSLLFAKSKVMAKENIRTLKIDRKDEAVADMLFDLMSEPDMSYIIDIGGSDNTYPIIEKLKQVNRPKTWVIPTTSIRKYLANAVATHDEIGDANNTVFCLNMYSDFAKIQKEFIYFFGDTKIGIKPFSPIFAKARTIGIPFSHHFEMGADEEQTIYDSAAISRETTQEEAEAEFYNAAGGDREKFHKMMMMYWRSQEAAQVFAEIEQNCSSELFS